VALYEVTLRMTYVGQNLINTFAYFSPFFAVETPSALELLTLMGFIPTGDPLEFGTDTIADNLQSLQNTGLNYTSIEARELYSVSDFYEAVYSPPLAGTYATGDAMSPLVSYGLYTNRVRLDIRRGFKRFGGMSEGMVAGGGLLTETFLGFVSGLAEKMSEPLTGVNAGYIPCVISREKVVDPETEKVTYELYPTRAEQEEHIASGITWAPYSELRSQVSRQYRRGS